MPCPLYFKSGHVFLEVMFPSKPRTTTATREDFLRKTGEAREGRIEDTSRTVAAKRIQVPFVLAYFLVWA